MADDDLTPGSDTPRASSRRDELKSTFRTFTARLDRATAEALRVTLGVTDLDALLPHAQLVDELRKLQ
jgi:hypothetical protein